TGPTAGAAREVPSVLIPQAKPMPVPPSSPCPHPACGPRAGRPRGRAAALLDGKADVDAGRIGTPAGAADDLENGVGGPGAHLAALGRNRAQRGHRGDGEIEVVEADDGDFLGYPDAAALAFEQRSKRQVVVAGEDGADVRHRREHLAEQFTPHGDVRWPRRCPDQSRGRKSVGVHLAPAAATPATSARWTPTDFRPR